jgi:hypothetical protein
MTTKKAGAKRGASKRSSKKAAGGGEDDFTSGATNENIRPDPNDAESGGGRRRPVQQELIPDRKIAEIDAAARDYEDTKLRRMALTTEEVEKKEKLKGIMKKHKRETYLCDGVEIIVSKEETETIKVKVAKPADD